ncbi:hypothetical protein F5890DRAFT_1583098 [Lentinula detonsa]|uniref:Uncharacterized protein n=1 Tax=Lentinula detonsa TaxID=2804962 RepID=A0AA38Q8B5_9AGAR|nr:hypothetical protein F5890DRAFT_1583098 [Lentinula detonsa]
MANPENAYLANPSPRNSVPRIDLSKAVNFTSAKKNKNKNSTPSSSSLTRKPMDNLNRTSSHTKPLGLLSPPSSQTDVLSGELDSERKLDHYIEYGSRERDEDSARLLISPPPEEELQQVIISRRSSFNRPSKSYPNDTTKSIPSSSLALSHSKRKRSVVSTSSYVGTLSAAVHDDITTNTTEAQTTPNPKPRKQSRKFNRAHVRTYSNQSDISMEAIPSPTRGSGIVSSASTEHGSFPLPSSLADGDVHTTPRRKRRQSKLIQSPHVANPNADYIPPVQANSDEESVDAENNQPWPFAKRAERMGRRSITPAPIPPYEQPSVVFTPPREVVLNPVTSVTRSRQRRKVGKSKGLKLDTQIKSEPPDNEYLNAPMPPASPTDDPLLLSGPPESSFTPSRSRIMRDASVSADIVQNIQKRPSFTHDAESLPPSSPPTQDDSSSPSQITYHWLNEGIVQDDWSTDSMELSIQPQEHAELEAYPHFMLDDFLVATADSWSDTDDEGLPRTPVRATRIIDEGIGEFTGHWRTTQIPTKADPPSSATRSRMDEWGRPKSPYPYRRPSSSAIMHRIGTTSPSPSHPQSRANSSAAEKVLSLDDASTITVSSQRNDQAAEVAQDDGFEPTTVEPSTTSQDAETHFENEEENEEQEVRALSLPPDNEDEESTNEEEVRRLSLGPDEVDRKDGYDSTQEEAKARDPNLNDAPDTMPGNNVVGPSSFMPTITPHHVHSAHTLSSPAPLRDLPFLSRSPDKRHPNTRVSALGRAKELFGTRLSPEKPSSDPAHVFNHDEQEIEVSNGIEQMKKKTASDVEKGEELLLPLSTEDIGEMSSGDESDPINQDPGLIQITSSDPKAAARAAAILKQHDYDCYTKIVLKQQQQRVREKTPHTTIEKLKRDNRRKTLSGAGICKGQARTTLRHSLGTVIGDMVYMPGSPVTTLGGLLEEAEREVQVEQSKGLTPRVPKSISKENALVGMALGERPSYQTPLPAKYGLATGPSTFARGVKDLEDGSRHGEQSAFREWSKEEWKILDACFTDERIDLASKSSSVSCLSTFNDRDDEIPLAEVDLVDVDNVIERFIIESGGVINGCSWSRDNLRARTKAIQKKQRAGHIAPPTTPYTSRNTSTSREPSFTMEIPDFTPLPRRPLPFPPSRESVLPSPAGPAALFSNIPEDVTEAPRRRKVPATLLAPRYSHLLDQAVAISRELPSVENSMDSSEVNGGQTSSILDAPTQPKTGLGRLFSYLPGFLTSPASSTRKARDVKLGLPLPPAEILDKLRGPIITPARPPVPKNKAPKELVNLNHQPVPEKKETSMIPRRIPQRMVKLNQVGLPEERQQSAGPSSRPRRSSGASVKDLVKTFESFDDSADHTANARSIRNWKKGLLGGENNDKPVWKP